MTAGPAGVEDQGDDAKFHVLAADDQPRLAEPEAVELTEAVRDHGEPHAQRYAQHLLDRYHTLRQLPTVHGQAAADPDRLHDVLEEMRRLVDSQHHRQQPDQAIEDDRELRRLADMSDEEFAQWGDRHDDRAAGSYAEQQRDAYLEENEDRDLTESSTLLRQTQQAAYHAKVHGILDRLADRVARRTNDQTAWYSPPIHSNQQEYGREL